MMVPAFPFLLHLAVAGYLLATAVAALRSVRAARPLIVGGLLCHGGYLVARGFSAGILLPNPVFEGPFFLPWCLALVSLIPLSAGRRGDALPALIATCLFALLSLAYPAAIQLPTPRTNTLWATLFFITENVAHALFIIAGAVSLRVALGRPGAHLPQSLVAWGFVFYSISQVTGAFWCYLGWGHTFHWSPRHLGTAAIWTFFAAYLHLAYLPGWSSRRKAMLVITGCALVVLTGYSGNIAEFGKTSLIAR